MSPEEKKIYEAQYEKQRIEDEKLNAISAWCKKNVHFKRFKTEWYNMSLNESLKLAQYLADTGVVERGWIDINDRANPMTAHKDCLIKLEDGQIRRYNEDWEEERLLVTHWMPLPKNK